MRGVDRAIKAGSYEIETGITLPQLLAKLTQGDVTQTALTIVEGATFADMRRALRDERRREEHGARPARRGAHGAARRAGRSAEGLFFPDTYFFAAGSTDVALLKRARTGDGRAARRRVGAARAPDLPLATPYEALILASIVEKETGHAADRPLIASVFVNRLRTACACRPIRR